MWYPCRVTWVGLRARLLGLLAEQDRGAAAPDSARTGRAEVRRARRVLVRQLGKVWLPPGSGLMRFGWLCGGCRISPSVLLDLEIVEGRPHGRRADALDAAVHVLYAAAPYDSVLARAGRAGPGVLADVPVLLPRAPRVRLRHVGQLRVREHRALQLHQRAELGPKVAGHGAHRPSPSSPAGEPPVALRPARGRARAPAARARAAPPTRRRSRGSRPSARSGAGRTRSGRRS